MKANGIKHIRSAPYHAATNGKTERCVQTFKKALKSAKADPGNSQFKFSSVFAFLKRPLKTRLDLSRKKRFAEPS